VALLRDGQGQPREGKGDRDIVRGTINVKSCRLQDMRRSKEQQDMEHESRRAECPKTQDGEVEAMLAVEMQGNVEKQEKKKLSKTLLTIFTCLNSSEIYTQ
jgi:hypothetical protein